MHLFLPSPSSDATSYSQIHNLLLSIIMSLASLGQRIFSWLILSWMQPAHSPGVPGLYETRISVDFHASTFIEYGSFWMCTTDMNRNLAVGTSCNNNALNVAIGMKRTLPAWPMMEFVYVDENRILLIYYFLHIDPTIIVAT